YGAFGVDTEFATRGGGWAGVYGAFVLRYRELLEGRLDGAALASGRRGDDCHDGMCIEGGRLVLTPSIGPHLEITRIDGDRRRAIVITPNVGYALVTQH